MPESFPPLFISSRLDRFGLPAEMICGRSCGGLDSIAGGRIETLSAGRVWISCTTLVTLNIEPELLEDGDRRLMAYRTRTRSRPKHVGFSQVYSDTSYVKSEVAAVL
jgi:hypothetical protein